MLHPSGREVRGPYAKNVQWDRVPRAELDICDCGHVEWRGDMNACECGAKACADCMKLIDGLKQCPVCVKLAEAEREAA